MRTWGLSTQAAGHEVYLILTGSMILYMVDGSKRKGRPNNWQTICESVCETTAPFPTSLFVCHGRKVDCPQDKTALNTRISNKRANELYVSI